MIKTAKTVAAVLLAQTFLSGAAVAQDNPFESGWTLENEASNLNFLSVKKGTLMEVSSFAKLNGTIDADGNASFEVLLDSVDTGFDLRNVRMRFLMFETFMHPKATVTAKLTPEMLADLETSHIRTMTLPFSIELHGVRQEMEAEVKVTLLDKNSVVVSTLTPIVLKLEAFDLMEGREKLEEAAEVVIVPSTSVTFNLAFGRNTPVLDEAPVVAAIQPKADAPEVVAEAEPRTAALEPEGPLSVEACIGRFEVISRTGRIQFDYGSSEVAAESAPLLENVSFILEQCPSMVIEVAGHTDSKGRRSYNAWLSQMRAEAVVNYLVEMGHSHDRFVSRGYGESRPIATNATEVGRIKNRRIEFSLSAISGS